MRAPRARAFVVRHARPRGARMRAALAAATSCAALLCLAPTASAQTRILPASKPSPPCVQVRIGQDEAGRWDCVNDAFKAEVARIAPVAAGESPGERLAPIGQGLAVPAATRQRLGDRYGKSVTPQRPVRSFPATPLSRPPVH